ncbi:hypothetical protein [Listeria booriae]|uniref:hypothetical protein n=1 Tax=Listeria booriae TaxID=1552123 RepID=UPI001E2A6B05|nr:hypothetical protein [Listeria booriae]
MQEIQTYFISAFLGCSVQVISLMMGIQILTRGAFTKINLVILYIVLIIESMTLLYYIQYFSLIFTLGILVLALRLKKIRWTLVIGLPFVCVAYLVAVDYIVNITTILVFSCYYCESEYLLYGIHTSFISSLSTIQVDRPNYF